MKLIPRGIPCLLIIGLIFGYMGYVMGFANMLNTMMTTAHDLLLNTVFYLMGMCVLTGALGKILVEFGAVDLLQKMLRPVMKPLFNMPGVASLGAVLTFLSDNPAIIALSRDPGFARYFKRYQHVSLVNFGTAFGMGLLVIVFMIGQGYYASPFIGFGGAICGCIIATRLMQHFTLKDFPEYKEQSALEGLKGKEATFKDEDEEEKEDHQAVFIRILNSLLDGGKDGVQIGLAIIPGVIVISTFVMMMTFGGTVEGYDAQGNDIVVYTGAAYQGTQLLPWLADNISFVFEWLFGFNASELIAFPITALGAVGAALGLIPEFVDKGIIDGNAIAVFTAMGMCWSGYLSTDAATLDSLGYRRLVPRALLSTFVGGICAGVIAHWAYVAIFWVAGFFAPQPVWQAESQMYCCGEKPRECVIEALDDNSYVVKDWYGVEGTDLEFRVNSDSTIAVTNAYAEKTKQYYFVRINPKAVPGEVAYAALYPVQQWSEYAGDEKGGYLYTFVFLYDTHHRLLERGYYELTWGRGQRQTAEAEQQLEENLKKLKEQTQK